MKCPFCGSEMESGFVRCRDGVRWSPKKPLIAALVAFAVLLCAIAAVALIFLFGLGGSWAWSFSYDETVADDTIMFDVAYDPSFSSFQLHAPEPAVYEGSYDRLEANELPSKCLTKSRFPRSN